jgi:hypothetical protein
VDRFPKHVGTKRIEGEQVVGVVDAGRIETDLQEPAFQAVVVSLSVTRAISGGSSPIISSTSGIRSPRFRDGFAGARARLHPARFFGAARFFFVSEPAFSFFASFLVMRGS